MVIDNVASALRCAMGTKQHRKIKQRKCQFATFFVIGLTEKLPSVTCDASFGHQMQNGVERVDTDNDNND